MDQNPPLPGCVGNRHSRYECGTRTDTGIATTGVIGLFTGSIGLFDWLGSMGTGITGMGELIIITLMAGGMLELIRFNGGVDYIIQKLTKHVNSKRGAELCIAALVSIANFCTANNTIAIITVGPLANDIATRYRWTNARVQVFWILSRVSSRESSLTEHKC